MRFTKMHGIGNDFILVDGFTYADIPDPGALSAKMCDRHFGVGADGLIWMVPSDCADARMRIFNSDGSEPEMCGNGLRCAAQFLRDERIVDSDVMTIETLAGVLTVTISGRGITADMGEPILTPAQIPVYSDSNRITLNVDGHRLSFFCVSMGNPHAVTFDIYPDDEDFRRFGAYMERHPLFPAKANIEFCRIEDRGNVSVKVWERGDGPTLACGTGSCAVLAAGVSLGLLERCANVRLPGGMLRDEWLENGRIRMTGPAETVYSGEFE